MLLNASQHIKISTSDSNIDQIIFLNNMSSVNDVSISKDLHYAAIEGRFIHINGDLKIVCPNRTSAFKVLKRIADELDSDLYENGSIEGYFEVVKNPDVESLLLIGTTTAIEYIISSTISMLRENDTTFNFGDIFKLTVKNKSVGDNYVANIYPRNLTKDSIFLTGNLNSIDFSAVNLTAPQIYVENAELHVVKEIDGGTF